MPPIVCHLIYRVSQSRMRYQGFTIIELMVVVVILVTLSAIALPSVLAQLNKAKESEARAFVATINRAQQFHYVEHNRFGNLDDLELGFKTDSRYYLYTSLPLGLSPDVIAMTTAAPMGEHSGIRGFSGKVWIGPTGNGATAFAILCEGQLGNIPDIVGTTCP
ncbi:MAG: type IV pilin protein [Elainellaceae cyanobacterium]